jgi:hypothetical protein
MAPSPSGKAADCKSAIPGSNPGGASLRFLLHQNHFSLENPRSPAFHHLWYLITLSRVNSPSFAPLLHPRPAVPVAAKGLACDWDAARARRPFGGSCRALARFWQISTMRSNGQRVTLHKIEDMLAMTHRYEMEIRESWPRRRWATSPHSELISPALASRGASRCWFPPVVFGRFILESRQGPDYDHFELGLKEQC